MENILEEEKANEEHVWKHDSHFIRLCKENQTALGSSPFPGSPLWECIYRSGGRSVKGTCRGEKVLSENKDMGERNVKMRRKEKDQKERSWQRVCVGLKSWHLLNRAAALGAKCCQPAPLAWISALPLSLFSPWHFASSLFYAFLFTLYQRSISSEQQWLTFISIKWKSKQGRKKIKREIFIPLLIISAHLKDFIWVIWCKRIWFAFNCSFLSLRRF